MAKADAFFIYRVEAQIPDDIRNSVVHLKAANPDAPDSHTDVYLLGMSHVSQKSVQAVRSLIEATKPEVISPSDTSLRIPFSGTG